MGEMSNVEGLKSNCAADRLDMLVLEFETANERKRYWEDKNYRRFMRAWMFLGIWLAVSGGLVVLGVVVIAWRLLCISYGGL